MSVGADEFENFLKTSNHKGNPKISANVNFCLGNIRLVVEFTVVPGKSAAFHEEFNKNVAISQAENGCIQYETFTDFKNENTIWLLENWSSVHDLAEHFKAGKQRSVPNFAGFLAAPLKFSILK